VCEELVLIGVIAKSEEKNIVKEFFELFKTPWEFYREGKLYDVLLCSGENCRLQDEALTVIYNAEGVQLDSILEINSLPQIETEELVWKGVTFPIYTKMSVLECGGIAALTSKSSGNNYGVLIKQNQQRIVRIGYDLFREVAFLLSSGQPVEYAKIPTLEVHISILRDLMIEAGVPFLEIPPTPYGFSFITCLTHDIDFAGVRNHKFDHTMCGFFYRAIWRTFFDALNKKVSWNKLWRNLRAVFSLPAVYAGFAKDFWAQFDRYLEVEKGLKSTFFFLPYQGIAGEGVCDAAPRKRAGKYDIDDQREHILKIQTEGCEIGLHGIDAWSDLEKGKREVKQIVSVTGKPVYGVRIHWLYFKTESPEILEKAGLMYDSTYGYNEAVGFTAGTAQAFRPLGTNGFLELPLLIQDTAMFYSGRMGLSEDEALILCREVMENVSTYGGVLVINWHDRSLAPERLWGGLYNKFLNEIKSRRVWFGTGSEVTQWFERRRLVRFSKVEMNKEVLKIRLEGLEDSDVPHLKLKVFGHWGKDNVVHTLECKPAEIALSRGTEYDIPIENLKDRVLL
jgi:hypothetical protein